MEEKNKNHIKKLIAPIVIGILLILYYGVFLIICFFMKMPLAAKILFGLIPLCLCGVVIYVLAERIREIKGGEEDDLSQY